MREKGVEPDNYKNIEIRTYISDMARCLSAADVVVCRAGASSLSEFEALGKPSILIPSPNVTENHQFHNAMTLKRAGAAEVIEEKELTSDLLIDLVSHLIENKPRLEKMSKAALNNAILDANERIYEIIMQAYTGA
jgi:UDP-N-acetylglucosamine--N-acetylmuramyl-(pentapeptide) pyrophosphoryl-undecaprenol N-acetylglucosamine transferase